jgi:hypothetical protein
MCCLLVSGFLTEITQQIHSLRASGVISSHFARAAGSEMRTFRKSAGTLCTAPAEIAFLVMDCILDGDATSWALLKCCEIELDKRGGVISYEPREPCSGCRLCWFSLKWRSDVLR